MSEKFDPYYSWLAIPPREQPPNHYRLLGVNAFEANIDVIETAADRQMSHLRSFQGGAHAAESQALLNQLSTAKLCLLDPQKKAAYDATLRKALAAEQPPAVLAPAKPKAMPVAKSLDARRTPAATNTVENQLGFDPLSVRVSSNRAKKPPASKSPLLLIVAGVSVVALGGVIWLLAGGSDEKPLASAGQRTAIPEGSQLRPEQRPDIDPNPIASESIAASSAPAITDEPAAAEDDTPEPSMGLEEEPRSARRPDRSIAGADIKGDDSVTLPADSRWPVPDESAVRFANVELETLFAAELKAAKHPSKKILLANKLLEVAAGSDVPAECYASLAAARELAIGAGDATLALRIVDATAKVFAVDRFELAASTLEKIVSEETVSTAGTTLADVITEQIENAAAAEQFAAASTLAAIGASAATKGHQTAEAKSFKLQAKRAAAAEDARQQLRSSPDDARAQLVVGKYLCLWAGKWAEGLPYLSRGSDAAMRAAAELDMSAPASIDERTRVGDLWWKLSESAGDSEKGALRRRAAHWYEQILGEISGLSKAKVEKHLTDMQTDTRGAAAPPQGWTYAGANKYCDEGPLLHYGGIPQQFNAALAGQFGRIWGAKQGDALNLGGIMRGHFGTAMIWDVASPRDLNARFRINAKQSSMHCFVIYDTDRGYEPAEAGAYLGAFLLRAPLTIVPGRENVVSIRTDWVRHKIVVTLDGQLAAEGEIDMDRQRPLLGMLAVFDRQEGRPADTSFVIEQGIVRREPSALKKSARPPEKVPRRATKSTSP